MLNDREIIDNYGAALRSIVNRPFLESEKHQEQHWRANREGAHPKILEFEDRLIGRFARLGVPLFAHCVVKTPVEQDAVYVLGTSTIRGVDPYPHKAFAVDIIHGFLGWKMDSKAWDLIGHVGMEVAQSLSIPMTWGGDWDGDGDKTDQRLYDPAHWELAHWRSIEPVAPFMWLGGGKSPEGRIRPYGRQTL